MTVSKPDMELLYRIEAALQREWDQSDDDYIPPEFVLVAPGFLERSLHELAAREIVSMTRLECSFGELKVIESDLIPEGEAYLARKV